jgi:hypothetical protein
MQDTSQPGNGTATHSDSEVVEETPTTTPDSRFFPPTLVAMDPPTFPAADGLKPPHRNVDNRGPTDLPSIRPYPEPQRSVPGHPAIRQALRRVFLFWRKDS